MEYTATVPAWRYLLVLQWAELASIRRIYLGHVACASGKSLLVGTKGSKGLKTFSGLHQRRLGLASWHHLAAVLPDQLFLRVHRLGAAVLRLQPNLATAWSGRAGKFRY